MGFILIQIRYYVCVELEATNTIHFNNTMSLGKKVNTG